MARHRNRPTKGNDVRREKHVADHEVNHAVLERLGHYDVVCQQCNHSQPHDRRCRKCGGTSFRPKAADYRDS